MLGSRENSEVQIFGDERGAILGIATSQFVSLLLMPIALVMLLRLRRLGAAK